MLARRTTSLLFATSLFGFVMCAGFVGGCSLFGGDDNSGGSPPASSGNGGEGGVGGGAGGAGGMASSSSSSGMPVECSDHTNLDETNCSLVKQDCKDPAEMCVPFGSGTTCVFEAGVKGFGAPCSGNDSKECAAGLSCVFFTCSPYCCPSEEQAFCGNAKCNITINIPGGGTVSACNLAKNCTLFANDCPENQQCRLGQPDQELALCAPFSDTPKKEGETCQFLNDCEGNQVCSGNACRYTCLLADWQSKAAGEGGCPAPQTCKPASPNAMTYGVCSP
jgi:hypothetical protein